MQVGATSETAATESVRSSTVPVLQAILVDGSAYLRAGVAVPRAATQPVDRSGGGARRGVDLVPEGESRLLQHHAVPQRGRGNCPVRAEEPHLRVAGATTFGGQSAVAVTGSPATAARGRYYRHRHVLRLDDGSLPAPGCHRSGQQRRWAQYRAGGFGVRQVQPEGGPEGANRCRAHHLARFVLIGRAVAALACSGGSPVGPTLSFTSPIDSERMRSPDTTTESGPRLPHARRRSRADSMALSI